LASNVSSHMAAVAPFSEPLPLTLSIEPQMITTIPSTYTYRGKRARVRKLFRKSTKKEEKIKKKRTRYRAVVIHWEIVKMGPVAESRNYI